jgi:hypothetical protein
MFPGTMTKRPAAAGKFALVLMSVVFLGSITTAAHAEAPDSSVNRAHDVLKQAATGRDILSLLHFGAKYKDHNYVKTMAVRNNPDDFALVYRFEWEDDGITDLAVLCDRGGHPYEVRVLHTNAVISQPFKLAEAAIQVVGNVILDAVGKNVADDDRAAIRKAINNADGKALLETYLKVRLF